MKNDNDISRNELNARFELIESAMEIRIEKMAYNTEVSIKEIKLIAEQINEYCQQININNQQFKAEIKDENFSVKRWGIGLTIGAITFIIGIQVALMQLNASWHQTFLTNLLAKQANPTLMK